MPGGVGRTLPRGPVALPRPQRNGCNRTRSSGTLDCPRGRTPSVHRTRRTPWWSHPVSRVEGARRSVSLGVTRCLEIRLVQRGEEWTRAPTEQARSGAGMDVLDVAAPGAGAGRTRVGVDPADRGVVGFGHGTPLWVVRTTEVSADRGSVLLGRTTYLLRSFVACDGRPLVLLVSCQRVKVGLALPIQYRPLPRRARHEGRGSGCWKSRGLMGW